MKKLIKLAAVLLVFGFANAAFALDGGIEVAASASPYAFQTIDYNGSEISSISSQYGFGGKLEGRYFLTESLYAGMDVTFESFLLGSDFSGNYYNFKVMPEAGYRNSINDNLYAFGEAKCGLILGMYDVTVKPYVCADISFGCGWNINEKLALELSTECGWHMQKHSNDEYTANVFCAETFIGAKYKL